MAFDTLSEQNDEALLVLFAKGDQSAARALTARLLPMVFALARRMLNDPAGAEDVAQEAMLKLWKIAPQWRSGDAKISTWLYRISANLCVDQLRKRRTVSLENAPEKVDETPCVDTVLIANDRATALHLAIAQLPERQQMALNLRHFQELSNPEIAEVMKASIEAVESLLSRGRRGLASILAPRRAEFGFVQEK